MRLSVHALYCHCPLLYTIHVATDPSQKSIFTTSQSYELQYEACGAAIDRLRGNRWYLYTNVTGSGFHLDLIPKMRPCTIVGLLLWKSTIYTGLLIHHLHWRIPIEKARQCTAINFGIVRRVCGVLLSGVADNWYYLIWYWRGGKYILQFSFIVASVFMYYEWMFRRKVYMHWYECKAELETSE